MKTAFLTTALALAASHAQASLTQSNTTYNLLSAFVRGSLSVASGVVANEDDLWLSQQFQTVVVKAETALEAEKENYAYYSDLLTGFYDQAKTHDSAYKSLAHDVDEAINAMPSAMVFAPEEWTDFLFDVVEQILPQAKNETFASWLHSERTAMETLVSDGASTTRLVVAMDVFQGTLDAAGREISGLFTKKLLEVYETAGDAYAMDFSTEEDEEEEEEKVETKKPRAKKAKKAKHAKAKHMQA